MIGRGLRRRALLTMATAASLYPDRSGRAEVPEIVIGMVAAGPVGRSVSQGALLAVEQINAAGGVLGRNLRMVTEELTVPDANIRAQAISVARRLIGNHGLVAVIGHDGVADALPASITYFTRGVLFIAPSITSSLLNSHGLTNVFATIPDNKQINSEAAVVAYSLGLRDTSILRLRNPDRLEQALAFTDQAATLGMTVNQDVSFPAGTSEFRGLLSDMRAKPFDTLFGAAPVPETVAAIRQLDELKLGVTCILGAIEDLDAVRKGLGDVATLVLVPVLENPAVDTEAQKRWRAAFRARFGADGNDWAIQGTDAVTVLHDAIVAVGSSDPAKLAAYLRYSATIDGLLFSTSFAYNGRTYSHHVAFAQLRSGKLSYYDLGNG